MYMDTVLVLTYSMISNVLIYYTLYVPNLLTPSFLSTDLKSLIFSIASKHKMSQDKVLFNAHYKCVLVNSNINISYLMII